MSTAPPAASPSTEPSVDAAADPAADAAAQLYLPVTVQVAWTLARQRVGLKPKVIHEAREHVLRCLPPDCGVELAEFMAPELVLDWIGRLKHRRYVRVEAPMEGPWPELVPTLRALYAEMGELRLEVSVFRSHYGEREPLEALARRGRSDLRRYEAARAQLRARVRALTVTALGEGAEWETARVDHLLRRLANVGVPGGPGPLGLASPAAEVHARLCARTARAIRLVQSRRLDHRLLFPPKDQALVPDVKAGALALLLHPDARRFARRLERLLGDRAIPVGDDAWILAEEHVAEVVPALINACLEGAPSRHFLRGALVRDAGRWSHQVLLGPLPLRAIEVARGRPWGELDGVTELPMPRPPPPSAAPWWMAAGLACALSAAAALIAFWPSPPQSAAPVQADFVVSGDVVDVRFDVPDLATVELVALRGGKLEVVQRSVMAGKGAWATGEGDYSLLVPAQALTVIASDAGIDDLEAIIAEANARPAPFSALPGLLAAAHPEADLASSGRGGAAGSI